MDHDRTASRPELLIALAFLAAVLIMLATTWGDIRDGSEPTPTPSPAAASGSAADASSAPDAAGGTAP